MNAKVVIIAAVALALLGVSGWVFVKKTGQKTAVTQPAESAQQSAMQSLKDLLAAGVSQKCTFDMGSVVISGSKFKADINTTVDDKTIQTHMINDGEFSYIWGGDLPQGIKMKVDAATSSSGTPQYFDTSAQINYKCEQVVANPADFVVPADVTFTDLSVQSPKLVQ